MASTFVKNCTQHPVCPSKILAHLSSSHRRRPAHSLLHSITKCSIHYEILFGQIERYIFISPSTANGKSHSLESILLALELGLGAGAFTALDIDYFSVQGKILSSQVDKDMKRNVGPVDIFAERCHLMVRHFRHSAVCVWVRVMMHQVFAHSLPPRTRTRPLESGRLEQIDKIQNQGHNRNHHRNGT